MLKNIEIAVGYIGHEQELTHWLNTHVAESIQSFAVHYGIGYWKGIRENSATISWIVPANGVENSHTLAVALAAKYCEMTCEQCALVSVSPVISAYLVNSQTESLPL